ncbi:MAG: type II secretion system F family protein, partial [Atopobiaceae bacterium]|nr:type II secretion system F family protein [Atopobiaceae bacterium]
LHRRLSAVWANIKGRIGFLPSERDLCLAEMPEMIDVVTLALSAGLSFDSSLDLYCQRSDSMLSHLLSQALARWHMGLTTRELALREMSERLGVAALASFASATHDALVFGTPLVQLLESQARMLRDERRNQIERRMEQLPVKMLIPLGALILPAMLLSILGPLLVAAMGSV